MMALLLACLLPLLAAGSAGKNPFLDQPFYINPENARNYAASIATSDGMARENLEKMQRVSSAFWVDAQAKIRGKSTKTAEGVLRDAASKSPPELVVLVFYNLPNRDCGDRASSGEICCTTNEDGTCDYDKVSNCTAGVGEYKSSFVDPLVAVMSRFEGKLPMVVVMEPDGLANLAANIAHPHCGGAATQAAYKRGLKYAVEQVAEKVPSAAIYLDAGHGGWLGWENNLQRFVSLLQAAELPLSKVRGFATNVGTYQALGTQCPWCPGEGQGSNAYCLGGKHGDDPCCRDPCGFLSSFNFGNNELNYAAGLVEVARRELKMQAHVVIDTARNGVTDQRHDCMNWCNPRAAGAGLPSSTNTANASLVDAYFWLKTPGQSDGCSRTLPGGERCPRFDRRCESADSLGTKEGEPAAPEAGEWFDFQVKQLASNAVFKADEARSNGECPKHPSQPVIPVAVRAPEGGERPEGAADADVAVVDDAPADGRAAAEPTSGPEEDEEDGGNSSAGGVDADAAPPGNSSARGACAGAFQQCGGAGWQGPDCCQVGCTCKKGGVYYSQCEPSNPRLGAFCNEHAPPPPTQQQQQRLQQDELLPVPPQPAVAATSAGAAQASTGPLGPVGAMPQQQQGGLPMVQQQPAVQGQPAPALVPIAAPGNYQGQQVQVLRVPTGYQPVLQPIPGQASAPVAGQAATMAAVSRQQPAAAVVLKDELLSGRGAALASHADWWRRPNLSVVAACGVSLLTALAVVTGLSFRHAREGGSYSAMPEGRRAASRALAAEGPAPVPHRASSRALVADAPRSPSSPYKRNPASPGGGLQQEP